MDRGGYCRDMSAGNLVRREISRTKEEKRTKIAEEQKLLPDAMPDTDISVTLDEVLLHVEDAARAGKNEVIPERSAESQALGELAWKDKEHWGMLLTEVAKYPLHETNN